MACGGGGGEAVVISDCLVSNEMGLIYTNVS